MDCAKRFENTKDTMETGFGHLSMTHCLSVSEDFRNASDEDKKALENEACNCLIAHEFMMGFDMDKAIKWKKILTNDHAKGEDMHPVNLETDLETITNCCSVTTKQKHKKDNENNNSNNNNNNRNDNEQRENVSFANVAADTDVVKHPDIECFECNKHGHCSDSCPTGTANAQPRSSASVRSGGNNNTNQNNNTTNNDDDASAATGTFSVTISGWSAFNCGQTTGVAMANFKENQRLGCCWTICPKTFLKNVHESANELQPSSNGGELMSSELGTFPNFGEAWHNPDGSTNIASQSRVEEMGHLVECNSKEKHHTIKGKKGGENHFERSPEGLCHMPLKVSRKSFEQDKANFVQTAENNKIGFTKRQTEKAGLAKRTHEMMGFPSEKDFEMTISVNAIRNCPVTVEDVNNCFKTCGKNITALKGKSVCRVVTQKKE